MKAEDLKILLALEPKWTASVNGSQFLTFASSEISVSESAIQFGQYSRKILQMEWLRPNVVRIHAQAKFRRQADTITLYPGERLPSTAELRRKRTAFQTEIGRALCSYLGTRKIERQTLYSDRQHGIGGAYPRFLIGNQAVITVDPDETGAVVNGLMRAALLWARLVRRPTTAVVPYGRHQTIAARLRNVPRACQAIRWLQWDGSSVRALEDSTEEPETHVQAFSVPDAQSELSRICGLAPDLLQAVPDIAGKAISIRLRGIEVASISDTGTTYPFGEPLVEVVREL